MQLTRLFAAALLTLGSGLSLGLGFGSGLAQAQTVTLKWGAQNDIVTMDPHAQAHSTTFGILAHAYDSLIRLDAKFELEPSLATKWTYLSPTQVRFDLRKGVKFHDDSAFTADDVVFSYGRMMQPQGQLQLFLAGIKEVKKVDDSTVDFLLSAPTPLLLSNLVGFRIMSKSWAEQNKTTNVQDYKNKEVTFASRNANGTGPYRITSWQPDQKITMTRHRDWWDKATGNVTDVVYTPIGSDPTRVAALLSGELDMLTDLPTQDVARLRSEPKIKMMEGNEIRSMFFGLDQFSEELKYSDVKGKNPFKDKRVREALSIAVDREQIKRSVMRGLSVPAGIILAPGVNGHSADIDVPPKTDPDRAKKLLAEAGYPNGFEFQLTCSNNRYVNDAEICQAVAAMWARVGIRVKPVSEPFAVVFPKIQNFDSSAYLLGWGGVLDAQVVLQPLVRTRTTGADGSANFTRISDPTIDRLVDAMKIESDVAKRNAMIREALVRVRDEVLYIPLHHQVRPWAMKPSVETVYRVNDQPEARFVTIK